MAEKTFRTRHTISGLIDENTPENILEHPVLGRYLEAVGPDAKPFLPEMHKPSEKSSEDRVAPKGIERADTKPIELPVTISSTSSKNGKV